MARQVAVTTSDNPYDPITDYDNWERFDTVEHSYMTNSYLARVCHTTDELDELSQMQDIEAAIDEIVAFNLISWLYDGVSYVKVVHDSKEESNHEEQKAKVE